MSEFKFACPVCGQHITADSSTSGTQLNCPTCFQALIIPQAPAAGVKLIVSAVQVGKPRPPQSDALWQGAAPIRERRMSLLSFAIWVALLAAVGITVYTYRVPLVRFVRTHTQRHPALVQASRRVSHPIPTNINWTLNLAEAVIPDEPVSGGIHGSGFVYDRATLTGGHLTLRQGHTWPPDLGVTVQLFAKEGEALSGKTVEVAPTRVPPLPKVILRWKDDQDQPQTEDFTSGYALKMIFGEAINSRMPGKIFLSLPDERKSFVSGTFDAEIRKPQTNQ